MSEVAQRPGCVRPTMSESLARSRPPTAEGRVVHGAGGARRRADACRRFAFGRVTKEDDAPDRAAGTGRDTGRDNVRDDSPKSVAAGPRGATDRQRPAAHLTHQPRHASRSGRRAAVAALLVFAVLGTALPAAAQAAGICSRTQQVRVAILARISGVTDCALVTNEHLAAITGSLFLRREHISTLQSGDFAGLTAVTDLNLNQNTNLSVLPAGVFDDLTALRQLWLASIGLTALPAGVFDNLTALTTLVLNANGLTALPAGVFDNLTALTTLNLDNNVLTALPAGVFDDLTALTTLDLDDNGLTALPAGVFDDLTALETLLLNDNGLTALRDGVFDDLTALTTLGLRGNGLTALRDGVFDDLTALTTLILRGNPGAPFAPTAVAAAAPPTVASAGGTVTLAGSAPLSGNPWGANVTYAWALTDPMGEVAVIFDDAAAATSTVTIPALTAGTVLTFTLTVTGRGKDFGSPYINTATTTAATTFPTVRIRSQSIPEGIGTATLRVTLNQPAGNRISVPWSTLDGDATSPGDYAGGEGTLTFATGATEATISIPIVDDDDLEGVESFLVLLGGGEGYRLDGDHGSSAVMTILDNDGVGLVPSRATVNGTTLVLTYNEILDSASTPYEVHFYVTVDNNRVDVDEVSVSESMVTLTLATAVQASQTVTLDYGRPASNPIQDGDGNAAVSFSDFLVTNNTGGGGTDPPGRPAAPSVSATAGSGTSLDVTWAAPSNTGPAITSYDLQYREGTSGNFTTGPQNVTGTSAAIGSLTPNTSYEVQVRATNAEGDGDWSFSGTGQTGASVPPGGGTEPPGGGGGGGGGGSGGGGGTVGPSVPGAPASLRAIPGDREVELRWTAPEDNGGSPVTGYQHRVLEPDGGVHTDWTDIPDGPDPDVSASDERRYTVTGLANGSEYTFEVRAVTEGGAGEAPRAVATPAGAPDAPASLTATAGDGKVVLEWTEPADGGGSPVTSYEYRFAAGTAVPEDTPWQSAGLNLEWTLTDLTNGQQYAFEVRALNRVGPGETSGTMALPLRLRAELFSSAAAEGEALVIGVRRSGRLAFPAHAYIGVTDSALPGVTATEEGRDDGLGRHRLEFAAGAAEATVTVTVAFDGERRQDRVLGATLDSAELEVDGVRRPYELVTPTLVVPVTEGDAGLSVADARVQGKSSVLAFTVSLDRTRDVAVRVDYATEDGSARAGEDYTPVSGTLTIEAGGREGTVEVPVLPALHVTGERTLTLRLSNAVSAVIDDGVATGTIVRESELPKAWLARFGRTASDHAAQAIARRLEAGQRETQVTVAGRRVDGLSVDGLLSGVLPSGGWRPASAVEDMATRLAAPALAASGAPFGGVDADPGTPGLRAGTWGGAPGALDREPSADAGETLLRAVLPDFGFRLPGAEEALLGTSFYVERGAQQDVGGGKTWAAWGDVAATRFEGDAGGLALNGDVVTGTAGLDRQWRAVLVGLALSRSSGKGGYGTGAGTIASTLTSVHPYVQVRLGERAQVWGAAGWGRGGLEITPESGAALEADLRNSMAAAVGTASRGRLMLEGAGQIQGLGGVVRPKVEGGVRYDGGDAETGQGFEVGGGLDWARGSLTLQVNGRMLIAHADESYEEWGYSGSLVYEPGADGLGLQMRVGSSAGAAASGIRNLWALENASGLVRGGGMPFAQRFDAEVGYGLGRGTLWYPYFVADDSGQTRLGLKLSSGRTMGVGLEFGRRKSVDLGPQDAMFLRGELRF